MIIADCNSNIPNLEDYRSLGKEVVLEEIGVRLDVYLARKFLFHSRSEWLAIIRKKEVFVNTKPEKASYRMRRFDKIFYYNHYFLDCHSIVL